MAPEGGQIDNNIVLLNEAKTEYSDRDTGPFFVLVKNKLQNERLTDIQAGKILVEAKVTGITKIEKVNNFTCKVTLISSKAANDLIKNTNIQQTLNTVIPSSVLYKKGIIHDVDTTTTTEDIAANITSTEEIHAIQRITIHNKNFITSQPESPNNQKYIASNKLIVTFRCQLLPNDVQIYHAPRKVKLFKPRVKYCAKCNSYGHINSTFSPCRNEQTCELCGLTHAAEDPCSKQCKFCKKPHKPSSRDCEKFLYEQRVQTQAYYSNKTTREVKQESSSGSYYSLLQTQSTFPSIEENERSTQYGSSSFRRNFKRPAQPKKAKRTFAEVASHSEASSSEPV